MGRRVSLTTPMVCCLAIPKTPGVRMGLLHSFTGPLFNPGRRPGLGSSHGCCSLAGAKECASHCPTRLMDATGPDHVSLVHGRARRPNPIPSDPGQRRVSIIVRWVPNLDALSGSSNHTDDADMDIEDPPTA